MARPKEPRVGTWQRLELDFGRYWKTFKFIEDRRAKAAWGKRGRIWGEAADHFNIHEDTAKERYRRMKRSMTPEAMRAWKAAKIRAANFKEALTRFEREKLAVIDSAFTKNELNQIYSGEFDIDLIYEFACFRLKSRKRKGK